MEETANAGNHSSLGHESSQQEGEKQEVTSMNMTAGQSVGAEAWRLGARQRI